MKLSSELKESQAPKKSIYYTLAKIAGVLLGIGLICWFVSQSNPAGILDQLKRVNIKFFYLIAATFVGYLAVTLAWRLSFYKYPGHLSIPLLYIIRQIGESLAQINPTNVIAGETLKAFLLKKRNVPYRNSIVSFTISRFLVIFSAVTLIMIGIYAFFGHLDIMANAVLLAIIISIIFILFVLLVYRLVSGKALLSGPIKVLKRLSARFPGSAGLASSIIKLSEMDAELAHFYKTKKLNLIAAFLLSFSSWFFGALEYYIILHLLGFSPAFLSCVAVEVGLMIFKGLGAFIPGQIGVEEYASKVMLEFINIPDPNIWITVSILRRARQLFWIGVGFIAFLIMVRKTEGSRDGNTVYNA